MLVRNRSPAWSCKTRLHSDLAWQLTRPRPHQSPLNLPIPKLSSPATNLYSPKRSLGRQRVPQRNTIDCIRTYSLRSRTCMRILNSVNTRAEPRCPMCNCNRHAATKKIIWEKSFILFPHSIDLCYDCYWRFVIYSMENHRKPQSVRLTALNQQVC